MYAKNKFLLKKGSITLGVLLGLALAGGAYNGSRYLWGKNISLFVKGIARDGLTVGALSPCSTFVAKACTKYIAAHEGPKNILEVGAGELSFLSGVVEKFGNKIVVSFVKVNRVGINVDKENVHDVAKFIRDELNYDHVESVSGVDYPQDKEIEVVYHIGSYSDSSLAKQILVLATRAQREENPIPGKDATKLPTLRDIFYSVEFHEREVFEMFGVYFTGHPDNRRLLLPEDWADLPPLRKDFAIKGR